MLSISKAIANVAMVQKRVQDRPSMPHRAAASRLLSGAILLAVATGLCIAAANCMAQDEPVAGAARSRGRRGPSTRIEATSYIQWNRAPFDASHGAETYWLHLSAENMAGNASGGFTINMHPAIMGKLTAVVVKGGGTGRKGSAPAGPVVVQVTATSSYSGKNYTLQFDLVGDQWKPSPTPGGKGASVKGSIKVKMIDTTTKAVSEAQGARQTSVKIWQN